MRAVSAKVQAALESDAIMVRSFTYFKIKRLDNGAPFEYGFWNDVGNVSFPVIDPLSGQEVVRNFEGSGSLVSISGLSQSIGLQTQATTVTFSQIQDASYNYIHTYNFKQGIFEIYEGFFDPVSRLPLDAAQCQLFGYIDEITVNTPEAGGDGSIELTINSHAQEIRRMNTSTRSDADQQNWFPCDNFCQDTTVVSTIVHTWGQKSEAVPTTGVGRVSSHFSTLANV
ncbi:hypothetical protein N5853_11100 [Bartonella sp. HY329]|uniref:hypothetical protein n=1 Tax=unclassified Bartonella TaxID=2645622 RepID=UPI0021C6C23B|nr:MULTISPECIES: hypothetical protein [unclassified Bartonella]UXM94639.1 hypothetical protein N5853_11100 [Bartonella sp. HY329]UXN08962.1 hypothetical protein N5852_11110 [Bartonella sp. HY328]